MSTVNDVLAWFTKLFQWWCIVTPWELGLRIRLGNRVTVMTPGIYLKLPIVDQVYVHSTTKRAFTAPVQTISTQDKTTLTIVISIGYRIKDIQKFYMSLYQPEMTISNMILGVVSEFISNHNLEACRPGDIEKFVSEKIISSDLGIEDINACVVGYAIVKTYRLIQDGHSSYEGVDMTPRR